MRVSTWMTPKPYCVTVEDHLDTVAAAMQGGGFRHVPVVDDQHRLSGIVTDRDVRQHHGYLSTTKVSAAFTEPAVAVGPDDAIEAAAQILLDRKIGGLPVIDSGCRVVGMLTTTDLLRGLLDGIGGAEGAARIDLGVAARQGALADAVQSIEAAGVSVLSVGTWAVREGDPRRFFVRVPVGGVEHALAALKAAAITANRTGVPSSN